MGFERDRPLLRLFRVLLVLVRRVHWWRALPGNGHHAWRQSGPRPRRHRRDRSAILNRAHVHANALWRCLHVVHAHVLHCRREGCRGNRLHLQNCRLVQPSRYCRLVLGDRFLGVSRRLHDFLRLGVAARALLHKIGQRVRDSFGHGHAQQALAPSRIELVRSDARSLRPSLLRSELLKSRHPEVAFCTIVALRAPRMASSHLCDTLHGR
mmetsp:Transcript_56319/g.163347  ORF Transcript_56319/g.163347 Transcript_56319/m.163347 type:complete len:210 (+) Transcript_56319:305-934(+)